MRNSNYEEQSPHWQAASCSASHKIPRRLWQAHFHILANKNPLNFATPSHHCHHIVYASVAVGSFLHDFSQNCKHCVYFSSHQCVLRTKPINGVQSEQLF